MLTSALPAAIAVVLGMLASPLPQRQPTPEEQRAFSEGLRLYDAGDARGAERAWKAGYAAGHDPAFLARMGEAEEKAGAPEEAVRSYEQYLRETPDAADRADIESRVRRLSPPSRGKAADDLEPGDDTGSVADQSGPTRATPGPVPGPAETPRAALPRSPDGGRRRGRVQEMEDLTPLVEDELPGSRLSTAAWITTGAATLLLGVAAFFGATAADKSGEANRLLTYADTETQVPREYADVAREYDDNVRDGQRDDRIAKGLAICAGVAALAAAVMFVVDGTTEKAAPPVQARADSSGWRPRAVPHRADGASGLGISWSF
jgi:hypothetical protein